MASKPNLIRGQGVAFKLAQQYGFSHPSEIDLESIAMDRGVLVVYGRLHGCEARLVRKGRSAGLIRVRDDIPAPGQKRFALAHDLGHWELHDENQ